MTTTTNPSSRRALLAAAAGGTVALVAESLARPLPARAQDSYVVLGGANESSSATSLRIDDGGTMSGAPALSLRNDNGDTAHGAPALRADSYFGSAIYARSVEGYAIYAASDTTAITAVSKDHVAIIGWGGEPDREGESSGGSETIGVMGRSGAGTGVQGMAKSGVGVHGGSDTGTGVYAYSPAGSGLHAQSDSGIAVQAACHGGKAAVHATHAEGDAAVGWSKTTTGLRGIGEDTAHGVIGESAAVGVEGRTTGTTTEEDMFQANVIGVWGRVDGPGGFGIAVKGDGANGCGVLGQGGHCGVHGYGEKAGVEGKSLTGTGVSGQTNDGVAVSAGVFPGGSGIALVADGPVMFSTAGRGNLVGGRAKVTPGVALDDSSKVLITLMGNPGAQAIVPYVEVTPGPAGTGFFRVRVPGARATAIPFAYFVIS